MDCRIWDKNETVSRDEMEKIQLDRLQKTVKRVYENVPVYRKKFDEAGVVPEDIKSLKDLSKLPFTVKSDFRENYPFGLFSVGKKDIVRFHASSGTTGKPTVVGYTRNDMDRRRRGAPGPRRSAATGAGRRGWGADVFFVNDLFTFKGYFILRFVYFREYRSPPTYHRIHDTP